jgi:hypothetical protein
MCFKQLQSIINMVLLIFSWSSFFTIFLFAWQSKIDLPIGGNGVNGRAEIAV